MHHDDNVDPAYDLGHPASMKLLVGVFVALLVLTGLTVWVAELHLSFDFAVSMLIAGVKASLVAIFFMHLNHDSGMNRIVMVGSILFFALFLAVVLGDASYYQPDVTEYIRDTAN
jgi:cytochrome c oxidase subunit 4